MLNQLKLTQTLAICSFFVVILTYIVIGLGALTRLTDAGLGCPDWPACYGHFTVPTNPNTIQKINQQYTATPLVISKARAEMIHRYVAGTLGALSLLIVFLSALIAMKRGFSFLMIPLLLLALIIYQIILGMLTVTLKLSPMIVTQHLLGGMSLLSLFWLLHLRCRQPNRVIAPTASEKKYRPIALFALLIVFFQMILGAWTSTNYAALICHGFPLCHASTPLLYDFKSAFHFAALPHMNYDGGVLNDSARMTIHMTHRVGALLVFVSLLWLFFKMRYHRVLRKIVIFSVVIFSVQILLGISNVLFQLPLTMAILHNLMAATLLLAMVTLNHFLYRKNQMNSFALISRKEPRA